MPSKEEIINALSTVAEFCEQYPYCQNCPVSECTNTGQSLSDLVSGIILDVEANLK